ncbi:MAG: UPF0182 family protein [Gemmatimonadetes bacterium]|nr:UPF0182 family protein [Gemmatimonadota bacterium]
MGIDSVQSRDLEGVPTLTLASLGANAATIENVRLWDRAPLLRTFGQLQEIRTYYDFVSVDDDRYWIDGKYRQVLLSPRELNAQSLPTRTFINEHLTFTHGMGLTMSPVNQVTTQGLSSSSSRTFRRRRPGSLQGLAPADLLRRAGAGFRLRGDAPEGVRLPRRGGQHLHRVCRQGRRPGGRPLPAHASGAPLRQLEGPALGRHHQREPRAVPPQHRHAHPQGAPLLKLDRDPYLVVADDGTPGGSRTPTPPHPAIPTRFGRRTA